MKRVIKWIMICACFLLVSPIYAQQEEPIPVIDPQGHSAMITDVLFTPDGQTMISVADDKTIRLWDVATGDLIKTIRGQIRDGDEGMLYAAALAPNGNLLAVGGYMPKDEIRLFNLTSGEQIGLLTGHTNVIHALVFSPDGKWLASGSSDKTVRLWEMPPDLTGFQNLSGLTLEGHTDNVYGVVFSPDGTKLVSVANDDSGILWDWRNQKIIKKLEKHTDKVNAIAFAPNGKYIVSGSHDDKILLWDGDGEFLKTIDEVGEDVSTVSFSADSQKIVVSGFLGKITHVYAIPSGTKLTTFTQHTNTVIASAFYGKNLIATAGGNNNDIYLWDANSGEVNIHIAGKGQRVLAAALQRRSGQAQDEGLNVAFGNRYDRVDDSHRGPLEKTFDFLTMTLNPNPPDERGFIRTQTEYLEKTLGKVSHYELRVTNGGTIRSNRGTDGRIQAYTFTHDGDVVVGNDFSLKCYTNDGTFLREFIGHTGVVWAVSVSADGRFLVSASSDQTIKLWNITTSECLATLFVTADNEWVCWTPQGYYAASAGGEKYIGWHINRGIEKAAQFYPVSVFRKRFYHPELVKRTIALGSFDQALAAINTESRHKIEQQAITQVLPPTIEWLSPQHHTTETAHGMLRIQAKISSDRDITDVKILVNGRAQAKRGLSLSSDPQEDSPLEKTIDQELTLTPGTNTITIFAANHDAGVTSDARIVVYNADWLKPNAYVVSVGISGYQQNELNLEFADDDAKAVSQLFRSQEGKLYKQVTTRELYNEEATRDNILDALDWLETEATQKDVVVIFLAAHGQNDQRGNFYLLPADVDLDKLRRTGVDWRDFADILGNLPSRVLLFLDTCHSGQLGQDLFRMRSAQVDNTEAIRELASDENGVVILAASTGKEFSMEHPDWGHGAFTSALLDGLEKGFADYSQDGIIHLHELSNYVLERVKDLTQGKQHPTILQPSTISRFPIVQVAD